MDSPAPRLGSEAPRRQQSEATEAFSWLNDKIGDMKIAKTDNNVFQFPPVSSSAREQQPVRLTNYEIYSQSVRNELNTRTPFGLHDNVAVVNNNLNGDQQQQQQRSYHHHQPMASSVSAAAYMMSHQDICHQNQQQHLLREKELELKNLEKIQQHRLEREQQRRQQEEQRRQHEELRRQQEDMRQRQELEMRQRREAEQREAEVARRRATNQTAQSADVFHFQQISTLSTVGQSQQTYAVDRNFIRELEKNLGDNESKFSSTGNSY